MDILLAHAYYLADDPVEQRVMKPYAPLGILSIAAYLSREGYIAEVFDATFSTREEFAALLERQHPPVVGIYITMMTKFAALTMIAGARRSGAFVVVGGPEPPHYAEEFIAAGADAVVIGEGELTVTELLRLSSRSPESLRAVAGLVFRDSDGSVARTPPRPQIADLDSLPLPDRSKVPIERYRSAWLARHGYSSLSMISMRGCPYTCKWCSHAVYGETYRRRSPSLFLEELATIAAEYQPDAFWFADDVFTINHRWFFAFADEVRRRGLRFRYECITRADRMSEEVVKGLAASGCQRLWIGSESGSQRILDAMSRGVRVEQVQAMTRLARSHGIEVGMFIMLGYPGETRADLEATVRHVKLANPDLILTTVAYPIKGTPFYEETTGDLILPELPFNEWNDRMIDLHGRYSKRFYWFANRRIINEAAWHRRSGGWLSRARAFFKAKTALLGMYVTS